jgi:hypothetical protein
VFCEKLLDISVPNTCSSSMGDFAKVAGSLDRPEQCVQAVSHTAEAQASLEIWRRFGGGSARNCALLGNAGNPVQFMRMAQSSINTDCFASG